jgi:hypothetical protein
LIKKVEKKMNKIKLFLGAACLVIAVAAAAATKVSTRAVPYYYIDNSNVCQQTSIDPTDCELGGSGCIKEVTTNLNKQVYDARVQVSPGVFQCQQPLQLID